MQIAHDHNLTVIEDAARAPGASLNGHKAGTLGHIGVYSLNFHKHIHTGEGGMAVTNDPRLARRLQLIRNHAEAVVSPREKAGLDNMIGQNYRMTELQAAIGIEQLKNCQGSSPPASSRPMKSQPNSATTRFFAPRTSPPAPPTPGMSTPSNSGPPTTPPCRATPLVKAWPPRAWLRPGYVTPIYQLPMYQKRIAFGKDGWPFTLAPNVSYKKGICPVVEQINDHEIILLTCLQGQLAPPISPMSPTPSKKSPQTPPSSKSLRKKPHEHAKSSSSATTPAASAPWRRSSSLCKNSPRSNSGSTRCPSASSRPLPRHLRLHRRR